MTLPNVPDLEWYWWLLIVCGVVGVGYWLWRTFVSPDWMNEGYPGRDDEDTPHVVYYVDEAELRQVASGCGVELPSTKEITASQSRRLGSKKLASIERGKSEVKRPAPLNIERAVRKMQRGVRYTSRWADDLEYEPHVPSKHMIEAVAERIKEKYGDQRQELLAELLRLLDDEIIETVLTEKRLEFKRVADANQTVFITGHFQRVEDERGYDGVRLVRFLPRRYQEVRSEDPLVPEGIELRVVFADSSLFTKVGAERMSRPQPFFGRVLAHSPTYDADGSVLTASGIALWSISRDSVQHEPYEGYGC